MSRFHSEWCFTKIKKKNYARPSSLLYNFLCGLLNLLRPLGVTLILIGEGGPQAHVPNTLMRKSWLGPPFHPETHKNAFK